MKIGISGVHGTGKSTKILELAKEYKIEHKNKKIGIIQENIINCPYEINENTTALSQYWIISNQIVRELEYTKKYDIVLTDRTVFDPICYALANDIYEADSFLEYTKFYGYTYDKVILIDGNNINYCYEDGIRSTGVDFRTKVNNIFIDLFTKLYNENWIKNLEIIK